MSTLGKLPSKPSSVTLSRLGSLPNTFTSKQGREAGIDSRSLRRLLDLEAVVELSRGVLRKADAPETTHESLLAVSLRAPQAVVCGESALALHDLIDDIPSAVHIAVPRGTIRPRIAFPPVLVATYAAATFDVGISAFDAAPGETVRVYSAARSVVDAMRLRHRTGEGFALHALGRYVRSRNHGTIPELLKIADLFGSATAVRRAVEAILA